MIPEAVLTNKNVWVNHLLRQGEGKVNASNFRSLLDSLSSQELKILRKNPDLIDQTRRISSMSKDELVRAIRDDYGLEVTDCMNGDVWIGTDDLDKFIPKWAKDRLPYAGWYLSYTDEAEQFTSWAMHFLLQEVRIRIWSRYMEKKIEKGRKALEIPAVVGSPSVEDADLAYYGLYL